MRRAFKFGKKSTRIDVALINVMLVKVSKSTCQVAEASSFAATSGCVENAVERD